MLLKLANTVLILINMGHTHHLTISEIIWVKNVRAIVVS